LNTGTPISAGSAQSITEKDHGNNNGFVEKEQIILFAVEYENVMAKNVL